MKTLLNFCLNNKMLALVNTMVATTFLTLLMFKGSHNLGFTLLVATAIIFSFYQLIKRKPINLFSQQDKCLAYSFIFYIAIFLLSVIFNGGKMNELDNPSRALLALPLILLFIQYPISLKVLIHCIPFSSFIAGIIALIQRLGLQYNMAFQKQMHIQSGDIAMSLGLFSLAISLYLLIKKHKKQTALYFIFSLFGILASVLSTARGGWIGVPFIILLILWVYRHNISKKSFSLMLLGLSSLIILAIAIPQTQMMIRIAQAKNEIKSYITNQDANSSVGARFDMWKSAILMAKERPILGWGQQGSNQQRQIQADQNIISPMIKGFNHAHNQYLDDLSKRGILGLLALLAIFFVPLIYFIRKLSAKNLPIKLTALLGCIHIISVMFYGLSQGFFNHNSGTIFYFLVTIIFYCGLKQQLNLSNLTENQLQHE